MLRREFIKCLLSMPSYYASGFSNSPNISINDYVENIDTSNSEITLTGNIFCIDPSNYDSDNENLSIAFDVSTDNNNITNRSLVALDFTNKNRYGSILEDFVPDSEWIIKGKYHLFNDETRQDQYMVVYNPVYVAATDLQKINS